MSFKLGTTDINRIYLGATEIKKIYLGATVVYDKTGAPPIAPVLSNAQASANGATGATGLQVTTDQPSSGTLYWGIYPTASTPSAGDIKAGTGATVFGNQAVSAGATQVVADQTGLTAETAYKAHYVQENSSALDSNVDTSLEFVTEAAGGWTPADLFAGGEDGWWYDFDDTSTTWQDTSRTIPADTNGDVLQGVTDKSGNGYHLAFGGSTAPTMTVGSSTYAVCANNQSFLDAVQTIQTATSYAIFTLHRTVDVRFYHKQFTGAAAGFCGFARSGSSGATESNTGTPDYYNRATLIAPDTQDDLYTSWSTAAWEVPNSRAVDLVTSQTPRFFGQGLEANQGDFMAEIAVEETGLTAQDIANIIAYLEDKVA